MRGEDAASRLPRVSQARETHVKGRGRNSPTERGPSRQDSQGGAQDAQHRRLKTQGPRRVAPAGGSSRASGPAATYPQTAEPAEGGPQLPAVLFKGQLLTAKQKMANRPRTQGHFCKTTGLVSSKSQCPEWGNRTAAWPLNATRMTAHSLHGCSAGARTCLCVSLLPWGGGGWHAAHRTLGL